MVYVIIPENLRKSVWGQERPGHLYISRKPKAGGGYDYEYPEEAKHAEPKEPEWRIHSIEDMRPIDWDTGKRVPLEAGSGATCERCGKEHAIVYHMEHKKTGQHTCVGSGCGPGMAGGTHNIDDKTRKDAEREAKDKVRVQARAKIDQWVSAIVDELRSPKFSTPEYWVHTETKTKYGEKEGRQEVEHKQTVWGLKDLGLFVRMKSPYPHAEDSARVARQWLQKEIDKQVESRKIPKEWPFPKDLGEPKRTVARQISEKLYDEVAYDFDRQHPAYTHKDVPEEMRAYTKDWDPWEKSMRDELHVIQANDFDLCMSWAGRLTDEGEYDRAIDLIKGAMHKYLRRFPSGKASPRWYYVYKVTNKRMGAPVQEGEKVKLTHEGQTGHYEVKKTHANGYVTMQHDETGHQVSVKQEHLHEMFAEEHKAAIDEAHTRLKHTFEAAKKYGDVAQQERAREALKGHEGRFKIKTPEGIARTRALSLSVLTHAEPSVENHTAAANAHQQAADMGAANADSHRLLAELHRVVAQRRNALLASAVALKDPDNRFHVPAETANKASTPILVLPKKGPRQAAGAFFGNKDQAYRALSLASDTNEQFLHSFYNANKAYQDWKAALAATPKVPKAEMVSGTPGQKKTRAPKRALPPRPLAWPGGELDALNQALELEKPKRVLGKQIKDPRVTSPAEAWDRLVKGDTRWDGKKTQHALNVFREWFEQHGLTLHLPEEAEVALNARAATQANADYAQEMGGEHEEAQIHDHIQEASEKDASFDPEDVAKDLDADFDFGFNAQATEEDPKETYQKLGVKAKTFKGFFGDWESDPKSASKVVNAKGEPAEQHNMAPMPVYHGTAVGGFSAFDPDKTSSYNIFGEGFYFTEDKGIAKEYTEKESDDAKWGAVHGFTDKQGNPVNHFPQDWAKRVISSTPGYGGVEEHAYTDRDTLCVAAALKRAMDPQGVNVTKFLQEYRHPSGPVLTVKGTPDPYMTAGSPMGLRAFVKKLATDKVGDYQPAVEPPQVFECYLNIRKPIDMEAPISREDFRDLAGYMQTRQQDKFRPQHAEDRKAGPEKWKHHDQIPFYTKNINDHPAIRKMGSDEYSKDFSYDDFLTAKAHLRAEKTEEGKDAYGILHLTDEKTLTWGDVHYIMTDAHNYQTEKRGFLDWAKKRGYDGIGHTGGWNVGTKAHKVWIAWQPNQIKAAGNEGTFNPTTSDIYKAMNPNIFVVIPDKLEKAARGGQVMDHAYIKREGSPGHYKYTYADDTQGKQPAQLGLFDRPAPTPVTKQAPPKFVLPLPVGADAIPTEAKPAVVIPPSPVAHQEPSKKRVATPEVQMGTSVPRSGRKELAVDVGQHVTGTRWEKAQAHTVSDLDTLSPEDQARVVTKKNLMPQWEPQELLDQGMSPVCVLLRHSLERCIQEKPGNEGQLRKFYMEGMDFFAKSMDRCKTGQDVMDFIEDWHHLLKGRKRIKTFNESEIGEAYDDYMRAQGKEVRMPWPERMKAAKEIEKVSRGKWDHKMGSPEYNAGLEKERQLKKEFEDQGGNAFRNQPLNQVVARALKLPDYHVDIAYDNLNSVTVFAPDPELSSQISVDNKYARMAAAFGKTFIGVVGHEHPKYNGPKIFKDAIGAGETWAKEKLSGEAQVTALHARLGVKKAAGKSREAPFKWERDVPDEIDRKGGRPVEHVTPQDLAKDFGFKNVQFGHWVTDKDANSHLKGAYGAFSDLADILGVDLQRVSLNGKLAVGIGARGSGKFAAHYEPGKHIINITKIAGGGCLAHEWAHAMDNLLAVAHDPGSTKAGRMVSDGDNSGISPSLRDAYAEVSAAIKWDNPAAGKAVNQANELIARINREKRRATREESEQISSAHKELAKTKSSQFYRDAGAFSKSADNYWTRPHEMFARAFESFVEDTLEHDGRKSSYLVAGTQKIYETGRGITEEGGVKRHAQIYPQGDTRKRINAAFQNLITVLRAEKSLEKALRLLESQPLQRFTIQADM